MKACFSGTWLIFVNQENEEITKKCIITNLLRKLMVAVFAVALFLKLNL